MPLREQDTAIWIGDETFAPVGSSGKVRAVDGKTATVEWGRSGDDPLRGQPNETRCQIDSEVVTPRQAANKGIEPWAQALLPNRVFGVWEHDYDADQLIGLFRSRADAEARVAENPNGNLPGSWPDNRGSWTIEEHEIS